MKLVDTKTGRELKIGDSVTTFRGEPGVLTDITKPKNAASTGRVYVKIAECSEPCGWYPGVIGAEWRDREDQQNTQTDADVAFNHQAIDEDSRKSER